MRRLLLILMVVLAASYVNAAVCSDGEETSCGITNVGECRLGKQKCIDGAWSICQGAVNPSDEICFDSKDNDCDGKTDEDCECVDNQQEQCGTDKGICQTGTRTCITGIWSSCEGAVLPLPTEICNDNLDNNCNGETDEGCRVATCFDKIQNQDEAGVDCGGPCPACVAATCFDNIKNQNEAGVDCGGPCPACKTEEPIKQNLDKDFDTLTDEEEVLLGTSPVNPDTDGDGLNDNIDKFPLCPNNSCDLNYGENSDNCPSDCKEEKGFSFFYSLIVLIFLAIFLFVFLYFQFFKKTVKGYRREEKASPKENVLVEISEPKKSPRKSKTESQLEKSFKKAEKIFRK